MSNWLAIVLLCSGLLLWLNKNTATIMAIVEQWKSISTRKLGTKPLPVASNRVPTCLLVENNLGREKGFQIRRIGRLKEHLCSVEIIHQ